MIRCGSSKSRLKAALRHSTPPYPIPPTDPKFRKYSSPDTGIRMQKYTIPPIHRNIHKGNQWPTAPSPLQAPIGPNWPRLALIGPDWQGLLTWHRQPSPPTRRSGGRAAEPPANHAPSAAVNPTLPHISHIFYTVIDLTNKSVDVTRICNNLNKCSCRYVQHL